MTIQEYTTKVEAITKPAEDAIAKLRSASEKSSSLSDLFVEQERTIRTLTSDKVNALTREFVDALISEELDDKSEITDEE